MHATSRAQPSTGFFDHVRRHMSGQVVWSGSAKLLIKWWTWSGSNRRPLPCHGSALPAAPQAHERTPPILYDLEEIVKPKRRIYVQNQENSLCRPNMELFAIICVFLRDRGYKL